MCGITGISLASGLIDSALLDRVNKILGHRGPDASGKWISRDHKVGLAQTRLSIVDLKQRSNQPLVIDDGNIIVNFNGEIYNYRELRAQLEHKHDFKTTSDTEVLGYAFKEYGKGMLSKIEGMFAFAIFNAKTGEMLIARDFVGQKPLLYVEDKTGFYFGSEIPALLEMAKKFDPSLRKKVDGEAIALYLIENFAHIPAPFTAFERIRKLEPSSYMIVKNGKVVEKKRYYRLRKKKAVIAKSEDEFIIDTIRDMKPSDVTYSLFLSGGNDSAVVGLGLRKENDRKIDAYTLKVKKKDEDYERSRYVAKELNLNHHVVDFDKHAFLQSVEGQVRNNGEPYYHMTSVYADFILRQVRKDHKVIFTGAGGDEVYYGYDNLLFIGVDWLLKLKRIIPKFILKKLVPQKYWFILDSELYSIKENYYLQSFENVRDVFSDKKLSISRYAAQVNRSMFDLVDIRNYVDLSYMFGLFVENSHSITIQSDLVGMKNSIEVRCPFLERRVIERGYGLGLFEKISPFRIREGKKIIKQALKKKLSNEFVYAKKIGFGVDMKEYDSVISSNYNKIRAKLKRLSQRRMFSKDAVMSRLVTKGLSSGQLMLIMKLYALEIWFEEYVD